MSKKIVISLSGSIACYKACALISKLVQTGWEVQATATTNALKFIGPATLEGLTNRPLLTDLFAARDNMAHISLTKWADLFLLYPATANVINKLHHGIADDLVTSLFLANNFKKPYWIGPAMNSNMFEHPATQHSLAQLQSWGATILPTGDGRLACGDHGKGRAIDPEWILEKIGKEFV